MVRVVDVGEAARLAQAETARAKLRSVTSGSIAFGIVGVGRMGANHAWALSDLEGVRLVTLCDSDEDTARRMAVKNRVESFHSSVDAMLASENLDAVVIATTTSQHREVALKCIEAGLHVLVEKPMCNRVSECFELAEAAAANGVRLMVGHVERFNPAIRQVKAFLEEGLLGGVYYIETERSGPFPQRLYGGSDGVVMDLAVHDLDLVRFLTGRLTQIYAHLIENGPSKQDVYARVMFRTEENVLGSSEFSWISPRRARRVSVYGDKGMLFADLQQQEVWYHENGDAEPSYSDNYFQNVLWGKVSEGKVTRFPIKRADALRYELEGFCELIRNPHVAHDPTYGIEAVLYSLSALESAGTDRIIYFDHRDGAERERERVAKRGIA